MIATNKSLAEYNLSLQPKLEDLKQMVAVDYERINALKTTLAEDKARLGTTTYHFNLFIILKYITVNVFCFYWLKACLCYSLFWEKYFCFTAKRCFKNFF